MIEAIKRCEHGSKRQRRLRRELRQLMDEVAKEVLPEGQQDRSLTGSWWLRSSND